MKRLLPLCTLLVALSASRTSAILDTNGNGLSDLWELDFNNQTLFPPNFNPSGDPDGDGWTNAVEAAAGTNPFDPNPPDGLVRPEIAHIPAVFGAPDENGIPTVDSPEAVTVTWPTLIGKQYTLLFSPDLSQESWIPVDAAFIGNGNDTIYNFEIHEPDNRFWRVAVTDIDRDNDGLSDWEEGVLELNPLDSDWDKDGITDGADPTPKANNNDPTTGGDPDGHLMTADVSTGLVAWWDFQSAPTQTAQLPQPVNSFPSRASTGYNLNFTQGIVSGCAFAGLGAGNSGTQPGTAEPRVLISGSPLLGSSSMTVSYWIQLVAGALTQVQGQPVPSVTLLAYTNQGVLQNNVQEPNFQWKATHPAGGGTRFSISALNWAGTYIDSTTALDDGRWHHLAFTFYGNGSNGNRIYLDGTQLPGNLTGFSFAQIPANAATSGGYLLVGGTKKLPFPTAPSANPVHELKGRIDSLMAHDRVLPAATIHDIAYRNRDSDQIIDRVEANTTVWRDNNSNGLSNTTADAAETAYLSSPDYWQSPDEDMDGDGATTAAELAADTDQGDPDSDDDLMPDGFEIAHGLNPNNVNDATQDKDGDGLCNLDEYRYGSDPETTNTDGDSADDLAEVNGPDGDPATDDGSDPADGTDNGDRRPAAELVSFNLGVGDRSGSHSEDYVLNVFRVDSSTGEETRIYTLRSGGFGSYTSATRAFKKGETYTFQIQWLGTNNHVTTSGSGSSTTIEGPDWDYHLVIEPQGSDTGGILLDSYDSKTKTIDTASPVRDPQDVASADDDDDNITDFPNTIQTKRVVLLNAELVPDWNRDGKIDALDSGQASTTNPWRFWINDDDDSGDTTGTDIPGAGVDADWCGLAPKVDGVRDLIDIFPVRLNIGGLLGLFPADKFIYRLRHQTQNSGGGLPLPSLAVYWFPEVAGDPATNEIPAPNAYLKQLAGATFVAAKNGVLLTAPGPTLPTNVLEAARHGSGVVMLEGRHHTTNPLRLEVTNAEGALVMTLALPLSIAGVEDMFRSIYVSPGAADLTAASISSDPPNWPDAGRSDKHFVFVHGYNVSGTQARGWGSEFFKRLFWSGSNARFSTFVWRGNEGQIELLDLTPDYQINLENAFNTAKSFKQFLDLIPGDKIVAAHSMGNVLVGAAMTDWNARPDTYFMVDAAAAKECYDPAEAEDAEQDARMVHPAWNDYTKPLRASEFHRLCPTIAWPASDWRTKLTWKGRLAGVMGNETQVYNFYSSGEEVLNNAEANNPVIDPANPFNTSTLTWATANKMWAMQEKLKGYGLSGFVFTGTYGGWLPNLLPYISDIHTQDGALHRMKTPAELPQPLTSAFLIARATVPFFDDSTHADLYDAQTGADTPGSDYARDHQHKLIAEMIPCTTFATGRNAFLNLLHDDPNTPESEERNIDMNETMKSDPDQWPTSDALAPDGPVRPWLHSDIREKAFVHNWKVYAKFVELGNLKQSN